MMFALIAVGLLLIVGGFFILSLRKSKEQTIAEDQSAKFLAEQENIRLENIRRAKDGQRRREELADQEAQADAVKESLLRNALADEARKAQERKAIRSSHIDRAMAPTYPMGAIAPTKVIKTAEELDLQRDEERREADRRHRVEEDRRAEERKRRDEDEAAARRRRDEEESSSSSSSSSSIFDSFGGGSDSSGGGFGGFGGGDSGGGGSSSDW